MSARWRAAIPRPRWPERRTRLSSGRKRAVTSAKKSYSSHEILVSNIGQQLLDLGFQIGCQRKKRQPCQTAVVAVEVHAVLESGNPEIADALGSLRDSFLLEAREFSVAFPPGCVDLVACGRCRAGEGENGSDRPGIERRMQLMSSPYHHLEADFLLAHLHLSDHR